MKDETLAARMERLLRTLPPAVRGMGFGDPDDAEYAHASDVVSWAISEIDRLREEPRGWLTAEERSLVESLRATFQQNADGLRSAGSVGHADNWDRRVRILDALLARSSPPRVRIPQRSVDYQHQRDAEWVAAIRAAGVEVEE